MRNTKTPAAGWLTALSSAIFLTAWIGMAQEGKQEVLEDPESIRPNETSPGLYGAGLQPLIPAMARKPGASPQARIRARLQRSACRFEYGAEGRRPDS